MNADCPLTLANLRAALAEPAGSPRARALLAHLETGCPACTAVLEKADALALLEALAGPGVDLSPGEKAALFGSIQAKIVTPAPAERSSEVRAPVWLHRWALAAAATLLLIVCGALALYLALREPSTGAGLKGTRAIEPSSSVKLRGFVGAAQPGALRPIAEGVSLRPGEVLFFRVDLSVPAFLYLVHVETRTLLFFPDPGAAPMPAGEYELTSGGRALALPGDRYSEGGTLDLLASPVRLSPQALERVLAELQESAGSSAPCAGCAHDQLRLEATR